MRKSKGFSQALIVCLVIFTIHSSAKAPFKFGKVSKEEMLLKVCEFDTSAAALVLYDYGVFEPEKFTFTKRIRIKILKKEGLHVANRIFKGNKPGNVRGKTFNLVDGKIEVDKLGKESIFKERVTDNYYLLRVTMPNVKVGSVIDIEYRDQGLPSTWFFQSDLPIAWSELFLPNSEFIDFRKNFSGYIEFEKASGSENHWIAKDILPFKSEPYLSSALNYRAKMSIDVLEINIPGQLYREINTDWNSVARRLNESPAFGQVLSGGFFLNDMVEAINSKCSEPYDKMKMAYDTLKVIKWNGKLGLNASTTLLRTCVNDLEGSSSDINLILCQVLRKLDIAANPLVMSTRSNGLVLPYSPSTSKLNNTIVHARLNGKSYLLDASEELLPLGLLPERCVNQYACIVNEDKGECIQVKVNGSDKIVRQLMLNIHDNLNIDGSCAEIMYDYAAYDYRKSHQKFNSEDDFIKHLEAGNKGLNITNLKLSGKDDIYEDMKTEMEINVRNHLYNMGEEAILNPMLHLQIQENPFKIEERTYPVEFTYPQNRQHIFSFKLPAGYDVTELPESINVSLPNNAASFLYQIAYSGNTITINSNFTINKTMFLPDEYPLIKQFYDIVVKKQAEPVILKKI